MTTQQKTLPTDVSVEEYLAKQTDSQRVAECEQLIHMMVEVTGEQPKMWGASMVGFGSYSYRYASGHGGIALRLGFSIRAKEIALYGFAINSTVKDQLPTLGKHRVGKGCLYIKSLADVNQDVLKAMMETSYKTPAEGEL